MSLKKVIITGGCGDIGFATGKLFQEKGFEVVAFDRYNPNNSTNTSIDLIYALKKNFFKKTSITLTF